MSAFVVEVEGHEPDVNAWLEDVAADAACTLQRTIKLWRTARFSGDGDDVRVRAYVSGLDAPFLVAKAAMQDILAVSRRTIRRAAVGGSHVVPPPAPCIGAEDLREELVRIAAQDTTSTATRLVDALDAHTDIEGDEDLPVPVVVRKVARLAIRVARDAEDHDRRLGIAPERRDPADLMWSALADRLEALELQRAGLSTPTGASREGVPSC